MILFVHKFTLFIVIIFEIYILIGNSTLIVCTCGNDIGVVCS